MAHSPAATAAAPPPVEPPGLRSVFHGFLHGPPSRFVVSPIIPNSGRFVLPSITAPAPRMRSTGSESSSGTRSAWNSDPMVVRTPAVSSESLIETGMP